MKRILEENEKIKVSIYIYLWESFHKSSSLKEFEEKYVAPLIKSTSIPELQKHDILRMVLGDFYSAHGVDIDVIFQDELSPPLLIKKTLREQENIFTTFLLKKLDLNPQALNKAEDRDDIYYLHLSDLKSTSLECFGELLPSSEMAHIYRVVIRKIFDLDDRDAIFFSADKAVIKFFNKNRGPDRRFNGIPEEKLQELYEKLDGDNRDNELNTIFARLMANELNLKKIDNIKFHSTYIKLFIQNIQKIFASQIEDKGLLLGFSTYFFRRHFGKVISMVVDEIFANIPSNDENTKSFINFYDGKEIIIGQKRLKKSDIVVDNQRYSYFPIYKIVVEKQSVKELMEAKEAEVCEQQCAIKQNQHLISSLSKELQYLKQSSGAKRDNINSKEEALKSARLEFQEIQIKLLKCKDRAKKSEYEERLKLLKDEIDFLSQAGADLSEIMIECAQDIAAITQKIEELKNKNRNLEENIKRIESKICELNESLVPLQQKEDNIKKALATAIIKFRI